MKKEYMIPMLSIEKVVFESPMIANTFNENDWGQSKKGFFGDDEKEMQEWNDIFSNDSKDPWNGVDDPWK